MGVQVGPSADWQGPTGYVMMPAEDASDYE